LSLGLNWISWRVSIK